MDCKNFNALDDMCKGCLSGGTSTNPKEQECYEEPIMMAVVGRPSVGKTASNICWINKWSGWICRG